MRQVSVEEAKTQLHDLIKDAVHGETVLITEDGHQVRLVPVSPSLDGPRKPGSAKGLFVMADDFDAPLEDFKDYMP